MLALKAAALWFDVAHHLKVREREKRAIAYAKMAEKLSKQIGTPNLKNAHQKYLKILVAHLKYVRKRRISTLRLLAAHPLFKFK